MAEASNNMKQLFLKFTVLSHPCPLRIQRSLRSPKDHFFIIKMLRTKSAVFFLFAKKRKTAANRIIPCCI